MVRILSVLLLTFFWSRSEPLPAFPGAEGWGAETQGGRGGKVYVVTNLNSTGPGSFNEGFQAAGSRIIVFRVSGVINVNPGSQFYLNRLRDNSYLTIAGQTSPGGITLTSSSPSIMFCYHDKFHDGVFRFLRFRAKSGNMDAVTFAEGSNMVFDHCDFSGGNDETHDVSISSHFTVQWCTIANSSAGQTYGSLMQQSTHISIHHSLYAHHTYRGGPLIHWGPDPFHPADNGMIDYRNNICYNASTLMLTIDKGIAPIWVNAVGNTFKMGPSQANQTHNMVKIASSTTYSKDNCHIETSGKERCNLLDSNIQSGRWGGGLAGSPWSMPPVTMQSRTAAYDLVLNKVGAWPRDPMNLRTIQEVRTGTGQLRKDNDPLISSGPQPPADADMDGMADTWETVLGLNPNDPTDNNRDRDNDGYTNIEEYVNCLADSLLGNPCRPVAIEMGERRNLSSQPGLQAAPNPYFGSGNVTFSIGNSTGKGKIRVLDMRGRQIAAFGAGERAVWSGKFDDGRAVPPGIYFIEWRENGRRRDNRKFTVMR